MEEHWFDALNKALDWHSPRRALLSAAAAVSSIALGAAISTEAARNKHKRKGKSKGKGKEKPPQDATSTCSGGACSSAWPSDTKDDRDNRDYCEFICEQCDGTDPRDFCIVSGTKPDGTRTKVARCCALGKQCCGGTCCGSNDSTVRCCGGACIDTKVNADHCGGCDNACPPGQTCRDGDCVSCNIGCCHANDSGTCLGPHECCTEACSTCVGGDVCLRWRNDIVGGYCEERPWTCGVVSPPCVVNGVVVACCGEGHVCTATGCEPV